jgi:hypothetical protein
MTEVVVHACDAALYQRWLNVATMRGRHGGAPLAPRWNRFRQTGDNGLGWLDLMEEWERHGHLGEKPIEFEHYVTFYAKLPTDAAR